MFIKLVRRIFSLVDWLLSLVETIVDDTFFEPKAASSSRSY